MMNLQIREFTRTVVVPIYKSQDHIQKLFEYIQQIADAVGELEILFVIDGSPDSSESVICVEAQKYDFRIRIIRLSRNFGVGPALHAALSNLETSSVVIVGSDRQEPFEFYVDCFNRLETAEVDVCIGSRISRDDPFLQSTLSKLFWTFYRKFADKDMPPGGIDGVGMSKKAFKALQQLPELNTNFMLQLQWLGFRRVYIPFARVKRESGKSSWTMRGRVKLAIDSIFGFSNLPIQILAIIRNFGLLLTTTILFFSIFLSDLNIDDSRLGNIANMISLLVGALILLGIGIIGNYVIRIYDNSKIRPKWIIDEIYTLN
jgi:glycosyltransferase involved in cell wall biosynthesis